MILRHSLALTLTLALSSAAANASPQAYVLTVAGQFGTMDLSTGALTPIARASQSAAEG